MKYFIGAFMIGSISFFVISMLFVATGIKLPEPISQYFWVLWVILLIVSYPFARKLIR